MVDSVDWANTGAVLEYGPGTGVFTQSIQSRMTPGTQFVAIEMNSRFVTLLRQRFPGISVREGSVAGVRQICNEERINLVDAIVCGLPWASFSSSLQTELLEATMSVLRKGGTLCTFAYLQGLMLPPAWTFRRQLRRYFQHVDMTPTVWRNIPPAFVYRCIR